MVPPENYSQLSSLFEKWNDWAGSACWMDDFFSLPSFPFTDVLELIALTTVNSSSPYRFSQCMCFPNCVKVFFDFENLKESK